MRKMKGKTKPSLFVLLGTVLLFVFVTRPASAQRELMTQTGGKGQLSIDTLVGLNIGIFNGPTYSGPFGIMRQSYSERPLANNVEVDNKYHATTIWLAPAADYFVIQGLSLGGLLELAHTSTSEEIPTNTNATNSFSQPSTLNVSVLPRIGYMIPLGDRFGIWPRLTLGYASRERVISTNPDNPVTDRFGAFMLGADVPFIFRLNETFYLSAAPQFLTSLGGSHTTEQGGRELSSNASVMQFGLRTGLGIFLDL